jgi:hypothetical protein
VVKTAIIQLLELDSKITLSVLCDQVVPPDDTTEDKDKATRERLPTLVVAFRPEAPPDEVTGSRGQLRGARTSADRHPPQADRDHSFLINSLLVLTTEIRGFRAGGVQI